MNQNDKARRRFLQSTAAALGGGWVAAHWPAIAAAAAHAHASVSSGGDATLSLLTPAQARDVMAIAAQIVPSGDTPGATEAGVVYFIDHVHAGLYASRSSDFLDGLAGFQRDFAAGHAGQFADLSPAEQLAYLRSVEDTDFFQQMRFLTVLGLLSLPSYGGNRDKLGWQLVGFEDRHIWEPPFGHYDREYEGFVPYTQEAKP
jgi:gluconate 2-dehydrogenase gamma chain